MRLASGDDLVAIVLICALLGVWGLTPLWEWRVRQNFLRLHAAVLDGDCEPALIAARKAHILTIRALRIIEAQALLGMGQVDAGRQALGRLQKVEMPRHIWWYWLHDTINSLITKGLYKEALSLKGFAQADYRYDRTTEDVHLALIEINLAEAEYNLGLWDSALQRMVDLDEMAEKGNITKAGLMLQRAWIHAHLGRGPEAWSCAERATAKDLPVDFRTERHYSRAAAHWACGRIVRARREVEDGLAIVRRPSSERNGWFLMARLAAAEEKWQEAADWCERAASHRFRFQGGDGLLLWGDVLLKLERPEEARKAWQLAIERDPQGECAQVAAQRLAAAEILSEAVSA